MGGTGQAGGNIPHMHTRGGGVIHGHSARASRPKSKKPNGAAGGGAVWDTAAPNDNWTAPRREVWDFETGARGGRRREERLTGLGMGR